MANSTAPATSAKPQPVLPQQVWYGIVCLIATAAAVNLSWLLWSRYVRYVSRRHDAVTSSAPSQRGSVSLKRVPNAVLAASRIVGFRWTIPGVKMMVLEVLVTIAYIAAILVWTFVNTDELKNNKWRTKSGILAAAQLPLLVVLSSKNNIISLLTGIGHEKLNLMHRVTSRSVLILTWVHLWGCWQQSPSRLLDAPWKVAGLVGGVAQTLLTFISIQPLRKLFYESFYISHVVLVLVFLVTTHYHCAVPGFGVYVWPCWLLWGLDRALRALRYLTLNVFLRPTDSAGHLETLSGDTVRLTLTRRVPGGWTPGQHVFLAFPTLGPPESHPFTIASIPADAGPESELRFVIRAEGGLTRRLHARALQKGACSVPVFVDGPYGCPPDITPFSTCVFVAGGSGVTYTLPRLQGLLRDVNAGRACAKRILFIWIIREEAHMEWISSALAHAVSSAPPTISFTVDVYVTGAPSGPPQLRLFEKATDIEKGATCFETQTSISVSDETPASSDATCAFDSGTTLCGGGGAAPRKGARPDVRTLLAVELAAAQGPVSVDVSGPDPLVDAVRAALSSSFAGPLAVLRGAPTVQLNVEQFRM